jgi:hypothetical protein
MIVITDSNIFFSALISPNGVVATVLKERKTIQYLVPEYLLDEIEEHLPRLSKFLNKTNKEIKKELSNLLKGVKMLSMEEISKENNEKAKKIVEGIDSDDAPFVAFYLQYKHKICLQYKHKIWSGDKELRKGLTAKGYGHFFVTTEELRQKLYKKQ